MPLDLLPPNNSLSPNNNNHPSNNHPNNSRHHHNHHNNHHNNHNHNSLQCSNHQHSNLLHKLHHHQSHQQHLRPSESEGKDNLLDVADSHSRARVVCVGAARVCGVDMANTFILSSLSFFFFSHTLLFFEFGCPIFCAFCPSHLRLQNRVVFGVGFSPSRLVDQSSGANQMCFWPI